MPHVSMAVACGAPRPRAGVAPRASPAAGRRRAANRRDRSPAEEQDSGTHESQTSGAVRPVLDPGLEPPSGPSGSTPAMHAPYMGSEVRLSPVRLLSAHARWPAPPQLCGSSSTSPKTTGYLLSSSRTLIGTITFCATAHHSCGTSLCESANRRSPATHCSRHASLNRWLAKPSRPSPRRSFAYHQP